MNLYPIEILAKHFPHNGNRIDYLPGLGGNTKKELRDGATPPDRRYHPGRLMLPEPVRLEAKVYKRDVVFAVRRKKMMPRLGIVPPRGVITKFTSQSQRRLELLVRNTADMWKGFVTLTYPANFPTDGRLVKRHIHAFTQWLRRENTAYVWILEFQHRGAPHFHLLVSGFLPKEAVAKKWYEIVGSWDQRHLRVGTRVEGAKNADQVGGYMANYMKKLSQKVVPEQYHSVGRFWGASRVLQKVVYNLESVYREACAELRVYRKFYEHKCSGWGFKWHWKGQGFMLRDGSDVFRSLLRQAVAIDQGIDVTGGERVGGYILSRHKDGSVSIVKPPGPSWEKDDGIKKVIQPFVTPLERIVLTGQYNLDGSSEDGMVERFEAYLKQKPSDMSMSKWLSEFDLLQDKRRGKPKQERGE